MDKTTARLIRTCSGEHSAANPHTGELGSPAWPPTSACRRFGTRPAMLIGLWHTLRRAQPEHIVLDDQQRRVWMLFADNGRYRPQGFAPACRPDRRLV